MKIRFASDKEKQPTHEQGLSVLYAPGKRMAFKVRWYLILFVVVSPLAFLAGRWLLSQLLIEATAQVIIPVVEVRAQTQGVVSLVSARVGDHIQPGQKVVELDSPEWRERLFVLSAQPKSLIPNTNLKAITAEQSLINVQLQRAEDQLRQVKVLFKAGAATRGEVMAAEQARDSRMKDIYQLEQRLQQAASVAPVDAIDRQRDIERSWIESRLDQLGVLSSHGGRVQEILVSEGESVGPGTLVMRLSSERPAEIWVYLDAKQAAVAEVGKPLTLYFPNGDQRPAHVAQGVSEAQVAPADLRQPFSASDRSLRVRVEVEGGLPEGWRIDGLGLRARFPHSFSF